MQKNFPQGWKYSKVIPLHNYFTNNKLFHPNLHGYRKHRSTQTALLQMYNKWVQAASDGQLRAVVLLDLSATFDLVDHGLRLQKLKAYGFAGWRVT